MGVERIHRPELDRKKPLRSFAARPDDRAPSDDAEAGEGGFVEEGVRAAYTVLDGYLRQGRRVARKIGRVSLPAMTWGSDSRERHARFLELTGELAANWFDLIGLVTESLSSLGDSQPSHGLRIAYEVASARPARVELEFQPGRATTRVTSHGLQCLDPATSPIPVDFEARDDVCLIVKIRVPEAQPPGLYAGVLLAADSGQIVGTLSLELR
jgi:hypothetical protein